MREPKRKLPSSMYSCILKFMKNYVPKLGERVEVASRFVDNCDNLLDVGCGDGIIQYFIGDRVKHIYGVDNSKEILRVSSKKGLTVKVVDLDNENLPFSPNYFNIVTCLDVIEHVRDPKNLLIKIDLWVYKRLP